MIHLQNHNMKDLNQGELDSATSGKNSLILFYTDWCYYCKILSLYLKIQSKILNDKVLFGGVKLNEDENPLWDKYGINAVPTLIAFSKNKIRDRRDAKKGVGLTRRDIEAILSNIGTKS
jgi:thioredoxin 1